MINLLEDKQQRLTNALESIDGDRIVCWFSHGIASTVAAKLAIYANLKLENPLPLVVADIYLKEENEDNHRFYEEVVPWLVEGLTDEEKRLVSFETLKNEEFGGSVDNVIKKTKYMAGVYGARCTKELKKDVRFNWQKDRDIHVFGMTSEEEERIDRLLDAEADLLVFSPLIEAGFNKGDCFDLFDTTGIEVPIMYKLGFNNNNCIGCLKAGGAGYWNHTRLHFPHIFKIRSDQEKLLNVALCKLSLNVFANKHTEDLVKFLQDKLEGDYKEFKIDGKQKPTRDQKGKPQHCVLFPTDLYSVDMGDCIREILPAGTIKGVNYETVMINSYDLLNNYTSKAWLFFSLCAEGNYKPKIYGSSTRVPLRYLPVDAGDQKSMYVGDCGFFCEKGENDN